MSDENLLTRREFTVESALAMLATVTITITGCGDDNNDNDDGPEPTTAQRTATPAPVVTSTPVVVATETPVDGVTATPGPEPTQTPTDGIACNGEGAALNVTITSAPGSDLDTGWTGISHNSVATHDNTVTTQLNCTGDDCTVDGDFNAEGVRAAQPARGAMLWLADPVARLQVPPPDPALTGDSAGPPLVIRYCNLRN